MKMLEIIETETDFSVVDDTLREPEHELVQARKQNAKLQNALREARDEIAALRERSDSTTNAPWSRSAPMARRSASSPIHSARCA